MIRNIIGSILLLLTSLSCLAGCAVNTHYWVIKDENSTAGKSQFSMLMAAYAAGKTVRIIGNNTCTRWADGEDILEVYLK
ncbi:hypothetical protein [Bowmanella denitrificans]|uniref:hypothetical protein n=1 Tax=Bowmanella denitrificans TaxID=366582 RepID=UPI000C9C2126|nr:hypothetical protein [Bowmanella denitrificans]